MIRSSKISLKFANKSKMDQLNRFLDEYRTVVAFFIDVLWNLDKIDILPRNTITKQALTWLSATAIQAAVKQASAIVRGAREKQRRRIWVANDLKTKGMHKKARKLQVVIDKNTVSKPNIRDIQCELDSRFVKVNTSNKTSFDGWIELRRLGNKTNNMIINIPFQSHKHLNSMLVGGVIKSGIRLGRKTITFLFEIKEPIKISSGSTIGIDIGIKTMLSCSDNQVINTGSQGWTYQLICEKLSRKKKGSRNYKQAAKHRDNYIHEMVNKIDLSGVKQVNRENIRDLRKGHRTSRLLSFFNYAEIFEVLDNYIITKGVLLNKVSPTYTSQRCSACGWVRKANRNGKRFKCKSCSFELDADLNASRNLAFNLPSINKEERLRNNNKNGFYWNAFSEEITVPHAQKENIVYCKMPLFDHCMDEIGRPNETMAAEAESNVIKTIIRKN